MFSNYKFTTALTTFTIFSALSISSLQAQEITGTNAGTATVIIDNTPVTDNVQPGPQAGSIDADGGGFNVPSINVGVDDDTANVTRFYVFDSVTGGDTVTFDGDIEVDTGTTNPDSIEMIAGSSDGGGSDVNSVNFIFNGNLDAGNGSILIRNDSVVNSETYEFSGATINLGSGGELLLHAGDVATFNGTIAQTYTGLIDGMTSGTPGEVVVDNAAGVTFVNGFGGSTTFGVVDFGTLTIAGTGTDSAATIQADSELLGGITLGDGAGTDTNTLTLDTTNTSFTLLSDITGTGGDTDIVVITGGNVFTQDAGTTYNVDNLTISGLGTIANFDATATTTVTDTVTIDSGATLVMQGNDLASSSVVINGTLQLAGALAPDVTGDLTGTGLLDVDIDATIDGDVFNSSVNIATGQTLTVAGAGRTYEVSQTTLNASSTLLINDGDLGSDIVANSNGNGTVELLDAGGTHLVAGNIGTSEVSVDELVLGLNGGTTADTFELFGDLYVNSIDVGSTDILRFRGTSQIVDGVIEDAIIEVGDGSSVANVTFTNTPGGTGPLDSFTVNENATANLDFNLFSTSGDLIVDGTFNIEQDARVFFADAPAGSAQGSLVVTLGTDASGNDDSTTLFDSGTALDFANLDGTNANTATLTLQLGTGVIADGQEFLIIDGTNTVANFTNSSTIESPSALYEFVLTDGATATLGADDTDIVVTANRVSISDTTSTSSNASVLNAILDVTPAQASADDVLASVLESVQTADDLDEAAESIQASVDGGISIAANTFSASSTSTTTSRLTALRTDTGTGIATGDQLDGVKVWSQAFGKTAEQDERENIDGFDLDTYGIAIGGDKELDDLTLGVAFSYGDSEIDSENANRTNTEIDSYQLTIYGDYDLDHNMYVSGSAYYAYHEVETTRFDVGGASGVNAEGDFSANQAGARLEVGKDFKHADTLITPKVMTNFSYYKADDYIETGAGGASLDVESEAVNVFEIGAGVDAKWALEQRNGAVIEPQISAEYRYDFIGEEVETNSTFTGTSASFQTQGFDPAQSTFNIGAALTYYSARNWEFTADYDYEFKADYDSHAGFIRAAYRF